MESIAVTTIAISVGAALVGTFLVLLLVWVLRRPPKTGDERIATLVSDMNARMDVMVRELSEALARAQEEGRRNRFLGELGGSIDLDEVLTRTLEAAGAVPGADAALITIASGDERPIVATLGVPADEAHRLAFSGPPDARDVRAIRVTYDYPDSDPESRPGDLIHGALAVPVPSESGPIGFLAIFTRSPNHTFGDEEVRELEDLAYRAGPAIENARRFREARQLAELDQLTGLHNRRYFHETLEREIARAQRYNRNLALIVFDLDDFKAVNDRIGHLSGDAVLEQAAERIRDVVRTADIACRIGGDEFAVILPESTLGDAEQLYRRLQLSISARPIDQAGRLNISAGIADLKPQDDRISFFERADRALYRAKENGKAQAFAADSGPG